jgi:hypothetical protein
MTLEELITALEAADQTHIAPLGFGAPGSYRGDYSELAFEPASNVTVASMLAHAKSALGATFTGYKGGEFTMNEYTYCYINERGHSGGDRIGPVLVAYLTGQTP